MEQGLFVYVKDFLIVIVLKIKHKKMWMSCVTYYTSLTHPNGTIVINIIIYRPIQDVSSIICDIVSNI